MSCRRTPLAVAATKVSSLPLDKRSCTKPRSSCTEVRYREEHQCRPVLHAIHRGLRLIVEGQVEAEGASVPRMHPERPSDFVLRLQRPAGGPCTAPHASAQRYSGLLQVLHSA